MQRNALFALLVLAAGTLGLPARARAQTCAANVPHVTGTWVTLPYLMPINPISATLLHTGKILIVAGSENDPDNYSAGGESYRNAVWDPTGTDESSITVQNVPYDVFCSGTAVLPDGRPLVIGGTASYAFTGDNRASIFNPTTETFVQSQNMVDGRWYGTATALGDGRIIAFSGYGSGGGINNTVEIYSLTDAGAGWTAPATAPFSPPLFPRLLLLPDGTVFFTGQGTGNQTANSWRFNPANQQWTSSAATTGMRQYGSAVLLPLLPPSYRPQVMNFGGSGLSSTEIIDLSASSPTWAPGPNMSTGRIEMNAVILPNGKVLAEGGSVTNEVPDTPGKTADLYDPVSNSFSSGGTASFSRLYHSTALLLPDATVMSMGSNPDGGNYEPAIEIYTPPYLFDANDQPITNRPAITGTSPASGVVGYNAPFSVTYTSASPISRAVLVRPGADTHGFDMDQRLIGLCGPSPQPSCSGAGTLNLTAPPNGNLAPPGYYMLFLLDSAGVPSKAQFIQLSPYTTTPPSGTITSPATDVTIPAGGSVAFGTTTAAAQYSWVFSSGSPATSTAQNPGSITFNTPGTYVASLTVIDGSGNSDPDPPTRTITVTPPTPDFSIAVSPSAGEVVPGQSTTFTVTVTPISGFTGTVSLSVQSYPSYPTGITSGGFNPTSISGTGSATLTMNTTAGASPYALSLTVTGTSGSISHTADTTLLVNIPPPLGLTATAGNAQVSLSWPASLGASSYTVQRALVSGGPYVTVGCPTTTSYTDTGLTNGTTYYYVVEGAFTGDPNAGGGSAASPEASATPQNLPLTSITVTPANSSLTVGGTQQFAATGRYSDGSTQNLTSQVTWGSSNTAAATISSTGLATAVASGTTTISATLGSVSGSTGLSVTAGPLTITTTALPAATTGVAYSATLTATGGTPPYTWSIASGTLPAGLTLTAAGVISGTPTATGTSSFTVKVTAGAQSVTKALGITVNPSTAMIWPSNPTPAIVDGGDPNPVTLGVKFQSDVAGFITGLRFYKAAANTGSHVGILWSSTGQSLATVGFTGETSSGWQQATLASPVAIQANTVYVASYFAPNGHYSGNLNYFATQGTDSPPLHALASGVAAGNGVYGYGGAGTFPTTTYQALNYWVDVIFSAQSAPTLTSIAVTPANATLAGGATQQYTATGTYSDSSTQNLTSQVTWASSNTAAATINSTGLATGVSAGTTNILATLGSVSGSTGLTVTPGPLTITTTALPAATVGVAYTTTLAATGGTPPYSWSIASGTLPAGLTLTSSTGVISGTPTATGTSSFTVQVTAGAQNVTKALGITVSSSTAMIWPSNPTPAIVDGGDPLPVVLGVKFQSDVAGFITGLRFYKAAANIGTHVGTLWSSTGQSLGTVTFTGETGSGWQQATFATPVAIQANTVYVASYFAPNGHYSSDLNYFATQGTDSPPLHALATGPAGGNGVYGYGAAGTFPANTYQAINYWVDVLFSAQPAPTLTSIAVTPANATLASGATQQYTATGTYSDSSTQNLTSQVTWASSNTAATTINSIGLATAVAAGTTTISATLGSVSGSTGLTVTPGPLTITTTTLPAATVGAAYTATLTATGGTPPYTWFIASGTLPAGLTLAASTGVISGTPTATGTSSFTVQVTSAALDSATAPLSITVSTASASIWPSNPTPAIVDGGDALPVVLGVKFRSDVAGFIKGLRFYKAAANTGTHVGTLWSSAGQSLGTVTFTGETGSGWQQATFATPVAIQANTVYVASYFAPNGHYSGNLNYFATQGTDTPPLHALATGVAGGNGVYGYGPASTFPAGTYQAINYWVDVVFSTSAQ
jgi:uncharacterized protein YjdB